MARIKFNYLTLQSQLSESRFETNNTGLVWGNLQSLHEISLYVSIACSHCGKAVNKLRRLLDIYPDFCFRLIFAVKSDNSNDKSNVITRHLIFLSKILTKNDFFEMLNCWYSMPKKTLEALQKSFPAPSEQSCQAEMDALYQFNLQAKINYAPTILVNGRLLTKLYAYQDLYGIATSLNAE